MSAGATTVLLPDRPTPDGVAALLRKHPVTVFYAVPTFYAAFLASPNAPQKSEMKIRCCVSAGEALPEDVGKRWLDRYGVDILDGIGSTEMLHIFLSQPRRRREVRHHRQAGAGLRLQARRRRRPAGEDAARWASCWSTARPARSCTGTTASSRARPSSANGRAPATSIVEDEDGYFVYCGRRDDMLKVSGLYVSPFEVEARAANPSGCAGSGGCGLAGRRRADQAQGLRGAQDRRKSRPIPRPVTRCRGRFRTTSSRSSPPTNTPAGSSSAADLPKTATGKIQRFKLRAEGSRALRSAQPLSSRRNRT